MDNLSYIPNDILACRACLITDVKLFNLNDDRILNIFNEIIGSQVYQSSQLPNYVCAMCGSLLLKYSTFKQQCCNSNRLLINALNLNMLTLNYIQTIDRQTKSNLKQSQIKITDLSEPLKTENEIQKNDRIDVNNDEPDIKDIDKHSVTSNSSIDYLQNEVNCKSEPELSDFNINDYISDDDDIDVKKPKKALTMRRILGVKKRGRKKKNDHSDNDRIDFENAYNVDVITYTKDQQIEIFESRKKSHNYLHSKHKCNVCFKGFISEITLNKHLEESHDPSNGDYICEICRYRFINNSKLLDHLSNHKTKYKCKECDHVSTKRSDATRHFKVHNGLKHECKFCDKSFIKLTTYLSHMRMRHQTMLPACNVCGQSFVGDKGMKFHRMRAHKELLNVESNCSNCDIPFLVTTALQRHLETNQDVHCSSDIRSCAHCGENYANDSLLREHLKQVHDMEINKTKSMKCAECYKTFNCEEKYVKHQYQVHYRKEVDRQTDKTRPYVCEICGKDFEKPWQLTKHERIHSCDPEKSQARTKFAHGSCICEICGKNFQWTAELQRHQRVHTGERPYKCDRCPKTFAAKHVLELHLRIHNNERPYKCHLCPKAFYSYGNRKRHVETHSGEKRYTCDICGKAFSQRAGVTFHVKTVHLKMPVPPRVRNKKIDKKYDMKFENI